MRVTSADGSFPDVEAPLTLSAGEAVASLRLEVPDPRLWSPESPHLYDCVVTLGGPGQPGDAVGTYFGLRTVGSGRWGGKPYEYVLLNGAPVYLRGALDQAFHPDGLHAYPSDAAVLGADVEAVKALGLNLLRCHIKVNDPRYYYWCDKLGVLMMYDLPSCDLYTPTARANWEATFRDALARDYSHPCIFAWILFNETWGLEEHQTPGQLAVGARDVPAWPRRSTPRAWWKTTPPTSTTTSSPTSTPGTSTSTTTAGLASTSPASSPRPKREGASTTSAASTGTWTAPSAYAQATAPLLNSEYAGLTARGGDVDISYSFKFLTTELRRHDMVCGYVYTEMADVEWEHNGFLNYDRSPKEFGYDRFVPGMTVADLNGADFVGLDCPSLPHRAPRRRALPPPVFFSHWDFAPLKRRRTAALASVPALDRLGQSALLDEGQCPIEPQHYGVVDCGVVRFTLPPRIRRWSRWRCRWWWTVQGAVRARNYVNVDVTEEVDGGSPDRRPW